MARLTECREFALERASVTVKLTVNLQHALSGASVDDTRFKADMMRLCDVVRLEAEEVADVAEASASEHPMVSEDEGLVAHHDCRNPTLDSKGSKAYVRVEITSQRKVSFSVLMNLVEALLASFSQYIFEKVRDAESGAAASEDEPVADYRSRMLGAQAALGALPGSADPQPGDHT